MKPMLFLAALLALTACASQRTVLVNSQGDQLTCETTGGGLFGAASVGYEQKHCISEAEQRGYLPKN